MSRAVLRAPFRFNDVSGLCTKRSLGAANRRYYFDAETRLDPLTERVKSERLVANVTPHTLTERGQT